MIGKFNPYAGMDMTLPIQRYSWLMHYTPTTTEEIAIWTQNAESVLIYCYADSYTYLDISHARAILTKAEKISQVNDFYHDILGNIKKIS